MKEMLKRGLSLVLALVMVIGLMPVTARADVENNGRPKDVDDPLVLSVYVGEGFPGEPAVYGTSNYRNFNSSFQVRSGATFASSAAAQLNWEKIDKDIVEGTRSGSTYVWGVYDANGTKDYFLPGATIINRTNEITMIQAVMGGTKEDAEKYEIIWYVIKLQHSPGSGFFGRSTTEWHIDGVIKEREKVSINYYGNGNTSGNAPLGVTNHIKGDAYTISDKNTLVRKDKGVEVKFLGWSAKADGTGAEVGFYQPGDVIHPTESISLYAMWDTTTQYTATVKTYLDGVLTDENEIHNEEKHLYLGTEGHYYELNREAEGVYTAKITGNGKFNLFNKNNDGTYTQVGNHQLTIYNQNGSLDLHHYSVTYDAAGGVFAADPGNQAYYYGDPVNAIGSVPTKDGYRFLGWKDNNGNMIQPGGAVTAGISAPIKLTAQWEKTVNVTINVTIDHKGINGGHDLLDTREDVFLELVSRESEGKPYLETGHDLALTGTTHDGFKFEQDDYTSKYTAIRHTYTDMPGGEVDYTVVASKSDYDTTVTATQDENGDWIIDVKMVYNPDNFNLNFTVKVDEKVPERYIPTAAIVKVTFWSRANDGSWDAITQQVGGLPGVRVNIDRTTRTGSGSYPVWMYESGTTDPYGYRIEITSFVYPDGTIVRASEMTDATVWSDDVYTATLLDMEDGKIFGTLKGAYIDETNTQNGILEAVITMDLHDVTFDAMGGTVNGLDSQTVTEQYKIPGFAGYVPVREGGYLFAGWYKNEACTKPATEGEDLTDSITLYAKWIEPLTISGTVSIAGSYTQDGVEVPVNDIDRATEAVVVLQEVQGNNVYDVDSYTVKFNYDDDHNGKGDYSFTGIPNDGKSYRIHVLELNYGTTYENEGDNDSVYHDNEYAAVFAGDNVADVDAYLEFVPPSYNQDLRVDATQIGVNFRPTEVLAEVMYRDTGVLHPFVRISQHNVPPYGVEIPLSLNKEGDYVGKGTESIWKWHTDGTLYDYQMNISEVDGVVYDINTAPFHIVYDDPAYWDINANLPSGDLVATLVPNKYPVFFDLNAGNDTVTGMDNYGVPSQGEDGNTITIYGVPHTWSYDTEIKAVPVREGYTFLGWTADVEGAYEGGKVPAAVHQEVTLTAQWKKNTYTVETIVDPEGSGTTTGAGTYEHGETATVTATPKDGYSFDGWYENGAKVSTDSEYSFTITGNRILTAKFELNQYTVTTVADPEKGGNLTGAGTYDYGETVTVTAVPEAGYTFEGWFENDKLVSTDSAYSFTVTGNRTLTAKFELNQYTVTTKADPTDGGVLTGAGTYDYGETATVTAAANEGYTFLGWFENGEKVSEDSAYSFTVTGNRTLTAKFELNQYTVTTVADPEKGGVLTGAGTYDYGETVTVTAAANEGYTFDGWYENGEKVSADSAYSFTVTGNRTLTAKFVQTYEIVTQVTTGGKATGDGTYAAGTQATVTATPDDGYIFLGWYENGEKVSEELEYSFEVKSDRTLKAHFAACYTITTIAENGGTVSGGGVYEPNATATITAKANDGYHFVGWYDENGKLVTFEPEYTLNVREDRTFTAKFEVTKEYHYDYAYIFGYNDRQIGADGPLLRGELAQMIYRLVKQEDNSIGNGGNSFEDTSGEWFQSGMSYMAKLGAVKKSASKAYPYAAVKRGEAYKMICLGLGFTSNADLDFSDYAAILRNLGYLKDDGKVTATILRWEFCELFNKILGRTNYCPNGFYDANGNEITAAYYGFTDLTSDQDWYRIMMLATSAFTDGEIDLQKRMERNTYDFDR